MSKELEDAINNALKGSMRENALSFSAFLRENGIPLYSNGDGRGWAIGGVVGNSGGYMMVDDSGGNLGIWINDCDFKDAGTASEGLKEFAWAHVVNCPQEPCVNGGCAEKNHRNVVFGREYESTCHSSLAVLNPDAETLENAKMLFLMLK